MGENRVIETTGIAVIAWLNDQTRYATQIIPAIDWLVSTVKSGGRYGSTQATILALKAITSYMQNFANLNGNGDFVLRLNGLQAQKISFTPDTRELIEFDFDKIMRESAFLFQTNTTLNITIALENFVLREGEKKDFRVNFAFTFNYYDTRPESMSSVLGFAVQQTFVSTDLGNAQSNGKPFTYKITLQNKQKITVPIPMGADVTKLNPEVYDGGLGMTVAIIRIPACLQIDFNFLENLKRNRIVDFYEVRNFNSEIVLYWRQMFPTQTRTLNIDLIQRYSGTCMQKPHTAYLYYNNDQPLWVRTSK